MAALTTAFAAALVEKLTIRAAVARRLKRIRDDCVRLAAHDAEQFAQVVRALRTHRRSHLQQALRTATDIPCRVIEHARAIQTICRILSRSLKSQFRADLRCAQALARAAEVGADAMIRTNLSWLGDGTYAATIQRRLKRARRIG